MKNFLLFLLLFLAPSITSAATYEVTNDSELTAANAAIQPGDTVNIHAGTYTAAIAPAVSGTSGSRITYQNNGSDVVTFNEAGTTGSGAINLDDKSYITIDGFVVTEPPGYWVKMNYGDYNIIQNCSFSGGGGYNGISMVVLSGDGANYNQILNNTFEGTCSCSEYCGESYGGPTDLIQLWGGNHNLIQGNTFGNASHVPINIQNRSANSTDYNVIRNNTFENQWHTAVAVGRGPNYTLIENNIIKNTGSSYLTNHCGSDEDYGDSRDEHNAIQNNTSYSLIRYNTMYNNGSALAVVTFLSTEPCSHNRVYNNTCVGQWYALKSNVNTNTHVDNKFINNNFSNNYTYSFYVGTVISNGFYFFYNNISGGIMAYANYTNVDYFANNLSESSLYFTDALNNDYTLTSTSPLINAGTFVATITSATASGTTFTVDDSSWFQDGWAGIAGDELQLEGKASTVGIVSISGNTIIVDETVSWVQGDGVHLIYNGISPEIGSNEYTGSVIITDPTGLLQTGVSLDTVLQTTGGTLTFTVDGTIWDATIGEDNAITTAFIATITGTPAYDYGWDAVVLPNIDYTDVTRVSDTVLTVNIDATPAYNPIGSQLIGPVVVPSTATNAGEAITTNSFVIYKSSTPTISEGLYYDATGVVIEYNANGTAITLLEN